jgi:hypothetical protein
LIGAVFIKERGAENFRKIRLPPILGDPIKDSMPSRTVLQSMVHDACNLQIPQANFLDAHPKELIK